MAEHTQQTDAIQFMIKDDYRSQRRINPNRGSPIWLCSTSSLTASPSGAAKGACVAVKLWGLRASTGRHQLRTVTSAR
jgi:xanthine dehydrogenase iron-sulfur cluster and FAD-binding subunit A